ncbi:hypothetical protein PINS_up002861 [Pythium insidiosum]|nr:hypothetical protein PINS_up002861 [Pythium insidiosum]
MLKGVGDALAVLPGALGFSGVAFSIAASFFALFGASSSTTEDPVLVALNELRNDFQQELQAITSSLQDVATKMSVIITGIEQVLRDISAIPAKVVAEMKLTEISEMKDKFASVQRAALQYTQGNLTRLQMISKCDDFDVAALFSTLETIVKDERQLFAARFGADDRANGNTQAQLLLFYLSVIPLVTNCNALKYSLQSIQSDGLAIEATIKVVYDRATWLLTAPDHTVHVRERFLPFATAFDINGTLERQSIASGEWSHAMSFTAYTRVVPPHARCFAVEEQGTRLRAVNLTAQSPIPGSNGTFCVKELATDDATYRIAYAERAAVGGNADARSVVVSIIQPEAADNFDALGGRGWVANPQVFYVSRAAFWERLPQLKVITDLVVIQAKNAKESVEDVSAACRALGKGYDRDGDAHSRDYKGAPWTIFCVQYATLSLRELMDPRQVFLMDMRLQEMNARDAWNASCATAAYVRDARKVTIPSEVRKKWFVGDTTIKAYAVCLHWARMTVADAPSGFVRRVWFDDSAEMRAKPKMERNVGDRNMSLPRVDLSVELV